MKPKQFFLLVLLTVFISACSSNPFAPPTPTSTETPEPTSTPTPTPTPPPTPTPTHTPTPTLMYGMGPLKTINGGFFSYRVPKGFTDLADMSELLIKDEDKLIIWFRVNDTPFGVSEEEMLMWRLADLTDDLGIFSNLEHSDPYIYIVDDEDGLAADFQMDSPFTTTVGRIVVIYYQEDQFTFFVSATQFDAELRGGKWSSRESNIFNAILSQIVFHSEGVYEPTPAGSITCQVSSDKTYGYSENNPIMVGSTSMFDGERRARAFLDALRGPNDQVLSYISLGSTFAGDPPKILDIYKITYSGHPSPITLYLDTFFYETPLAPVGFTCGGDFPFLAP